MKLSIVTTLYRSEPYVREFYERISGVANKLTNSYEIIFVDDGSPDNSLDICIGLTEKDSRVRVVELSRNFGHHKALLTGLEYSKGDFIFLIDSDLEEKPELLQIFWNKIMSKDEKNTDVIFGVQEYRKGKWFERNSGIWFYLLFNWLSDSAYVERNLLVVRIMRRRFVNELIKFKEFEYYFAPVNSLVGFNHKTLKVKKLSHSPTTYNFFRKYNMLVNSIFSFSNKPLFFIFYFGLSLTILSVFYGCYLVIKKVAFNDAISGWTSIIASIWFFGSIIVMFLGTMAIYLSKIFIETKKRPFTVVKAVHQKE